MDRYYIQKVAECTRQHLDLTTPVTFDSLVKGIEKIGGKCEPDDGTILDRRDAKLFVHNNDEHPFTIVYHKKQSEAGKTFSIARELGRFLMFEME